MAYKQIGATIGRDQKRFQGLSTDTKPTTNVGFGSIYYEVDTKRYWTYDVNINPATSNNWWSKTV